MLVAPATLGRVNPPTPHPGPPDSARVSGTPLPVIGTVTTIAATVDAIDAIIAWSIANASRLGYFAALYKRITLAVGAAVSDGVFDDGPRMERFDVAFAGRYFAALNGYFHPGRFPPAPQSWLVAFDAAVRHDPIVLQHMLSGINAHIDLDLGIAAHEVAPGARLHTLHGDFDRINAVLAGQVNATLDGIHEISPALADLYTVLAQSETFLIDVAVRNLRDSAWRFATVLAATPRFSHGVWIWARDRHVAAQAEAIYRPPSLAGVIDEVIAEIAARESRDVVANIRILDRIAARPAPIMTTLRTTGGHPSGAGMR